MKAKKHDQKYQTWYESIAIPIQTVRKFGNSYGITIPKKTVDKYDIAGKKVFPILLKRQKKILYELEDGHEWIDMSIREKSICKQALINNGIY